MMQTEIAANWESYLQNNYGTPSIHLTHGSGCEVWDSSGVRYLDFLGGIATNSMGHAHPEIVAAVSKQIASINHTSNFYSHPQVIKLAANLQRLVGDSSARTFFCNSGAEANESALKLSRLTGRKQIVSFEGSFHGRTMGALSMTGQPDKREPFAPLIKKVKFAKFNDIKSVRKIVSKKTAMIIVEPIQGERGIIPAAPGFLKELRLITKEHGTLLAIDAVQTGMGRTGQWFGYEHEAITPDVITLAKGLGGGLPIGAMIAVGSAAKLFTPGTHGSTFGGNPVAAASANKVIEIIETTGMLSRNFEKGEWLKTELQAFAQVSEVRGSGFLLGIVFSSAIAKEVAAKLLARKILVNAPNENVIRIAPAYVVTDDQIREFIQATREVLVDER
jgi:acetylornithine aminotransferase